MRSLPESLMRYAEYDVPLAPLTTWGIGGTAKYFFSPANAAEMRGISQGLCAERLDPFILGGGSNVLVNDGLIERPIIFTGRMKSLSAEQDGEDIIVTCDAGLSLAKLLSICARAGWSGLEHLAGIPGSIGGALFGNAGTRSGAIGANVETIAYILDDGESFIARDDPRWGYRRSPFCAMGRAMIMRASFRLSVSSPERVRREMKNVLEQRSAQPKTAKTAGCVFKNHSDGSSAGMLLDMAGCKGLRIGGASVSSQHANFFENDGRASAKDMTDLMDLCSKKVFDAFGIVLEREIKTLGFDHA